MAVADEAKSAELIARLEQLPFSRWHRSFFILAFFGIMFDAADFALLGAALPPIAREFGLGPADEARLKSGHMKIDLFNHFMPKPYLERLAALIPGHAAVTAFPRLATLCDVEARLRLLDEFGDLQNVLSLANPPLELIAGPDLTPELARLANDALAEICARHSAYFPAFVAALPMTHSN